MGGYGQQTIGAVFPLYRVVSRLSAGQETHTLHRTAGSDYTAEGTKHVHPQQPTLVDCCGCRCGCCSCCSCFSSPLDGETQTVTFSFQSDTHTHSPTHQTTLACCCSSQVGKYLTLPYAIVSRYPFPSPSPLALHRLYLVSRGIGLPLFPQASFDMATGIVAPTYLRYYVLRPPSNS